MSEQEARNAPLFFVPIHPPKKTKLSFRPERADAFAFQLRFCEVVGSRSGGISLRLFSTRAPPNFRPKLFLRDNKSPKKNPHARKFRKNKKFFTNFPRDAQRCTGRKAILC
jgi:hypothetical protein